MPPAQWQLVFKQEYKFLNVPKKPYSPIFIPNIFNSEQTDLAIQVSSRKAKDSWRVAGTLSQVLIDFPNQAIGDTNSIDLSINQVLKFSDKGSRFKLKFDPVKWLENCTISVWSPLMPLSQALPHNGLSSVTVTSTVTATATATKILSSNASRSGLIIYNNGTKPVYIGYDNSVTVSNASITIPSNSFWELSSPIYTGEVWAITSSNQTSSLNITEFI